MIDGAQPDRVDGRPRRHLGDASESGIRERRRSLGTELLRPECDLQESEIQDGAVEVLSEIFIRVIRAHALAKGGPRALPIPLFPFFGHHALFTHTARSGAPEKAGLM